ncbi:MAG: hypothetical protein Aurels2KO_50080 [Aureliella sp.]
MNFYLQTHEFYCGIDLHSTRMYLCVVDADGSIVLHKNVKANTEAFLKAIDRFKDADIVIAAESTYNWYWLADLCQDTQLPFVLGHALAPEPQATAIRHRALLDTIEGVRRLTRDDGNNTYRCLKQPLVRSSANKADFVKETTSRLTISRA